MDRVHELGFLRITRKKRYNERKSIMQQEV